MSFTDIGKDGAMQLVIDNHMGGKAIVVINPTSAAISHTLPNGEWKLLATSAQAGAEVLGTESGSVSVDAYSVRIYVN